MSAHSKSLQRLFASKLARAGCPRYSRRDGGATLLAPQRRARLD